MINDALRRFNSLMVAFFLFAFVILIVTFVSDVTAGTTWFDVWKIPLTKALILDVFSLIAGSFAEAVTDPDLFLKKSGATPTRPFNLDTLDESPGGYVYLIKGPQGWYKIGHTIDPRDRIKTFKVHLPFDVEFEHIIKCEDRHMTESVLHKAFAHRRGNGEWFALQPEDIDAIKSIKEM